MEHHFYDLSVKVLNKKASAQEQEELQNWLDQDPQHQQQFQEQKLIWELTAPVGEQEVDKKAAWKKVSARLPLQHRKSNHISFFPVAVRIAASIVLLAGIGWLISTQLFSGFGMKEVTAESEVLEILLPDSSKVWLNTGSKLVYDPDFEGKERQVKLEGEAFFEIAHNPERPFIVTTAQSRTRVLGTAFSLRAYEGEETTELAVATGKVAFKSTEKQDSLIVTSGFEATLIRESGHMLKSKAINENAWAWKTGVLSFSDQPLGEVIQDLERTYGMEFRLSPPGLADCRFTGTFRNAPPEEVIEVLTSALQLEVKKEKTGIYFLSGQSCKK